MERTFTLEEAGALLSELTGDVERLIDVRAELATQAHAHNEGQGGSIPDIKALEASMGEILDAIRARGVDVRGYAPILLDFPCEVGNRTVQLCWLEGEAEIGWFHEAELGFMGRRRLAELAGEWRAAG